MKTIFLLIFSFFLYGHSFAQVAATSLWEIKKSDHFAVYYQAAQADYVDEVIRKAEYYYGDIAEELGFTRSEEFWTWDKRTKIYLYNNKQDYLKAAKQPDWSAAGVNTYRREIYSYIYMDNFFSITLPHELTHIIFREYVGFQKKLPLCLDEGIASYMEKGQRTERLMVAKVVIRNSEFMRVDVLSNVKKNGILMPEIFYAESASLIEFLLKKFGRDKFLEFCRNLRDLSENESWQEALSKTYGFDNLSQLNKDWIEYLDSLPFSKVDSP